MGQAGVVVGATIASRRFSFTATSKPSLPPRLRRNCSPWTRSMGQAGVVVGATIASRRFSFMATSKPSLPPSRRHFSSASRYSGSSRPPLACARTSSSWPKYGSVAPGRPPDGRVVPEERQVVARGALVHLDDAVTRPPLRAGRQPGQVRVHTRLELVEQH